MLTLAQLETLARSLDERPVLTVYLDGSDPNPAARGARRSWLERQLAEQRLALAGRSHEEREQFARAVAVLESLLPPDRPLPAAPGWVAWIDGGGMPRVQSLPVPVPALVRWDRGPRIAPYVAAISRNLPALAVLVDSRRARILRVRDGVAEHVTTLDAPLAERAGERAGGGLRATSAADEAERRQQLAAERLLADLAEWLERSAGADEWIVVGGTAEMARRAHGLLAPRLAERALAQPSLHVTATPAEIARETLDAARILCDMQDIALVAGMRDHAAGDELATLDPAGIERALADRAVGELVLAEPFLTREPERAEHAVRGAIAQRAEVRIVSGAAAERLGEAGDGSGARLRFVPRYIPTARHAPAGVATAV